MPFSWRVIIPATTRAEAMARVLETGGPPPPGVRLLGRWTQRDRSGGAVLLESEAPHALAAFAQGWSDVVELTLVPVLADQALSEVLTRARARPGRAPSGGGGLPQAAAMVADQELPDGTPPGADQTGEAIPMPPPPAVPGGPEGEGEEPAPPRTAKGRPGAAA
jgi:Protein of unknown function (DUF3303)